MVAPGAAIPVRVQSYSRGDIAEWPGRLYLSADAQITTADIPVANFVATPLVPNTSSSAAVSYVSAIVPTGTAPGIYHLGAVLDPDEVLADTNRSDNAVGSTVAVGIGVAPPDVSAAPTPLVPADRAVFNIFPRQFDLDWSDVPNATQYELEVDFCYPWTEPDWWATCQVWYVQWDYPVIGSSWTINFIGAQPGRWRVRGLDSRGIAGPASPWMMFRSLQ